MVGLDRFNWRSVMPLVWYSNNANEVYHTCLDCEVHSRIYRRYRVFISESDVEEHIPELTLCHYCSNHGPEFGHDGDCRRAIFSSDIIDDEERA